MKTKLIAVIFIITSSYFAVAQAEYAVDKGAVILSGNIGFSSSGGDLYGSKRSNIFTLTPSVSAFVSKNVFLGSALAFSYQSQGTENATSVQVGPHFGYAGGTATSTSFPFFIVGIRYLAERFNYNDYFSIRSSSRYGYSGIIGVGAVLTVSNHLGMTFEGDFNFVHLTRKNVSANGNIISLNIGLCGLLYKGPKK